MITKKGIEGRLDKILHNLELIELTRESLTKELKELLTMPRQFYSREEFQRALNELSVKLKDFHSQHSKREEEWYESAACSLDNLLSEEFGLSQDDISMLRIPFLPLYFLLKKVDDSNKYLKQFDAELLMRRSRGDINISDFLKRYNKNHIPIISDMYHSCIVGIAEIICRKVMIGEKLSLVEKQLQGEGTTQKSSEEGEMMEKYRGNILDNLERDNSKIKRQIVGDVLEIGARSSYVRKRFSSLREYFKMETGLE